MEFIHKSFIQTTTSIVVNSNTSSANNLMTRDERYQYVSDGFNNDNTTTTITINFDETLSISRIGVMGMNIKAFTVFYDATTANTFSLTSTGATTASDFSTNSETSMYMRATPVNCTSVTFDLKSTIVANQNKAVGYLVLSNVLSDLDSRIPSARNYKPIFRPKEVVHELSDGSFRNQVFDQKFGAQLGLDFVSTSLRNELKTVFDTHDDFIFTAFGTMTSWDEVMFPCIWAGAFDFFESTDNAVSAGHSGVIKLLETRPS